MKPAGGGNCSGSVSERQMISTRTTDTTESGGDNSVSPKLQFTISYGRETTVEIDAANDATCVAQAASNETALKGFTAFYDVTATAVSSDLSE